MNFRGGVTAELFRENIVAFPAVSERLTMTSENDMCACGDDRSHHVNGTGVCCYEDGDFNMCPCVEFEIPKSSEKK